MWINVQEICHLELSPGDHLLSENTCYQGTSVIIGHLLWDTCYQRPPLIRGHMLSWDICYQRTSVNKNNNISWY